MNPLIIVAESPRVAAAIAKRADLPAHAWRYVGRSGEALAPPHPMRPHVVLQPHWGARRKPGQVTAIRQRLATLDAQVVDIGDHNAYAPWRENRTDVQ